MDQAALFVANDGEQINYTNIARELGRAVLGAGMYRQQAT